MDASGLEQARAEDPLVFPHYQRRFSHLSIPPTILVTLPNAGGDHRQMVEYVLDSERLEGERYEKNVLGSIATRYYMEFVARIYPP